MIKKGILSIACALLIANCGTSKKSANTILPAANAVEFSEADIAKAKSEFPNLTLADLDAGKQIYTQKCNACHGLKKITDYSTQSWKQIVPDMVQKANKKTANAINASQQEQLLKYVVSTVIKTQK